MYKRILAVLVLVSLASPASAGPLTESIARATALAASQAQTQDTGTIDWQLKVNQAQQRRHTGLYLLIAGAAVAAIGPAFVTSGSDRGPGSALIVIGGGTLATVGLIKFMGSGRDMDNLQQEGKAKGYAAQTSAEPLVASR